MSVHKEISEHSQKQHQRIQDFLKLDEQREFYIEKAVTACQNGDDFSIEPINKVTKEMNELSRQGIVPQRKLVSKEMIQEYVEKLKNK